MSPVVRPAVTSRELLVHMFGGVALGPPLGSLGGQWSFISMATVDVQAFPMFSLVFSLMLFAFLYNLQIDLHTRSHSLVVEHYSAHSDDRSSIHGRTICFLYSLIHSLVVELL